MVNRDSLTVNVSGNGGRNAVSFKARAVTESANASVTVGSACTLAKSVTSAHTASITNGSYYGDSGIGETLLQANCNDASGFAIYAIGYTGNLNGANYLRDNTLYSTYNDTYDITTGTGTSGNSNWSMKLTAVSNSDTPVIQNSYDSYHNVPSEYALVANKASGTTIDDGARVKATYTAYISESQPAGTYEGKVKYALVHPTTKPAPYVPHSINTTAGQICYYPNTNEHQGTMGCQTVSTSATSATLLASNFSRTGYGFAGWSDVYDYDTNPNAHFYGPQETITFTAGQYTGTNNGLSLYAVWVESAGSLQTDASIVCSSLTQAPTDGTANLSSVSALTDARDNQTYAIAKLADGKCWMIENLRLDNTNSDNSTGALAQGYAPSTTITNEFNYSRTYGAFSGLANPESSNFNTYYHANSLYYYGTQEGTATINIYTGGRTSDAAYHMPRYNNSNTANRASSPTGNSAAMYSYGNYYTWQAAVADLTWISTDNQSITGTSICPAGWRLPQGGNKTQIETYDNNDYWNLTVDALNDGVVPAEYDTDEKPIYRGATEIEPILKKLRAYPTNFVLPGIASENTVVFRSIYGYYWTSTTTGGYGAYSLNLINGVDPYIEPGSNGRDNYYGGSIRCLASGA